MMDEEPLVIVAIPPLVTLLLHHERQKDASLTQDEVVAIRDGAVCMTMPASAAAQLAEARGYPDVRMDHAWEDWRTIRQTIA